MRHIKYLALWIVALAVIAGSLLLFESDFLWKVQELNLFLFTPLFLSEQMVVPGGLLSWGGAFFTQMLYWPWLGILLLCAWWWLLMWLIKRAFRIPNRWAALPLIAVALLLLTIVDMGYWVYILKLNGHFFVATIGTTAVAALLWLFRLVPARRGLRPAFVAVTCIAGYPLLGIYGLGAALVMGIWAWRLMADRRGEALWCSVVAVIGIFAVPLFCYRYVFYQTNLANIWWAELPLYYVTESYNLYYLPFYLLALFFVVMALLPPLKAQPSARPKDACYQRDAKNLKSQTSNLKSQTSNLKSQTSILIQSLLLAVTVVGVVVFWFKDENFHRELAMQRCIDCADWEGALQVAWQQEDEPTRAIVMMRNIALSRIGRQGDDMFFYKNGSKRYAAPFDMRMLLAVGPLVYYHYGLLNYCNRLCVEMGVEFGFCPAYYKLMARCAIIDGETQLARKYLHILGETMAYDSWAEETATLLGHPDKIAADADMGPVTRMMHYPNRLSADQGYVERFLMTQLANSNNTEDPYFQEQCLLATLWTKDINQFWRHFYNYIRLHPRGPMPRYYQEAAWLYGKLQGRENLDQMPFDKSVKNDFDHFMQAAQPYDGAGVEEVRKALYPLFGRSYYYDYYAMRELPEY